MNTLPKILITGITGQVGFELQRALAPVGEVYAVDQPDCDLADGSAIRKLVRTCKPDVIVNSAAYTAVDKAESEPALAHAVNAVAPRVLGEEAAMLGAWVVHYSTDYVFDGEAGLQQGQGRLGIAGVGVLLATVMAAFLVVRSGVEVHLPALPFWFSMFGLAGTPEPVVQALHKALQKTLGDTELKAALYAMGQEVAPLQSLAEADKAFVAETAHYQQIAKTIGLQAQ